MKEGGDGSVFQKDFSGQFVEFSGIFTTLVQ